MCSLKVLATFLLIVPSSNVFFNTRMDAGMVASELTSTKNCSQFKSDPHFRWKQFRGSWKFMKIFSYKMHSPQCLKLQAKIDDTKIIMNVSFKNGPNHDSETCPQAFSLTAFVDMNREREDVSGTWSLFSQLSLAPSKWIVLSGSSHQVLYLICGDYPDQSSRVGEIGILSRESSICLQEVTNFERILANYDLNTTLEDISHSFC